MRFSLIGGNQSSVSRGRASTPRRAMHAENMPRGEAHALEHRDDTIYTSEELTDHDFDTALAEANKARVSVSAYLATRIDAIRSRAAAVREQANRLNGC